MVQDVFCKIVSGELKADIVYRDEEFIAIKDIKPAAPVHLLLMPIRHAESLGDFTEKDAKFLGRLLMTAEKVAKTAGLNKGYRLIVNEGEHGGKLVPHLHVHIVGGRRLGPKLVQDSH